MAACLLALGSSMLLLKEEHPTHALQTMWGTVVGPIGDQNYPNNCVFRTVHVENLE